MNEYQRVKDWYEALGRGDLESVFGALDPNIEWREAEGHPYQADGRPWFGVKALMENLFLRLSNEWDDFTVMPQSLHDGGDTIIAEGRYTGTFKATGNRLDAQFCHVWQVSEGRLVRFQQYVDTAQLQEVTSLSSATYQGDPATELQLLL